MMVPRSYRFASSPPKEVYDEQNKRRAAKKGVPPKMEKRPAERPSPPEHTVTEPMKTVSKPVAVPIPTRGYSAGSQSMPSRTRNMAGRGTRKLPAAHDPNALPPAVAALLAVTAIPPPRPNQFRRKPRGHRRVSIDELVNEWKSDDTLRASYSSSPALSVLLEDHCEIDEQCISASEGTVECELLHTRSTSSESVPSLEADDRSVLSAGSPSTPGSLRSRRSVGNLKRDRARSLITTEDSSLDHPLVPPPPIDEDDGIILYTSVSRSSTPKPRSTFKSNLTTSLRALKKATITSIASFSLNNATAPAQRSGGSAFSDEMLWSHPFLFPQFSSEVRPSILGTPTDAQRRYLNPMPLTFEEQEAPFQQALHGPYLLEAVHDLPTIPMQSYNRSKRRANQKRGGPEVSSEAGRALLGATGVRQREPRENSDFLRVVVLEMNMRREGKLESGRARIWLPPRQVSACSEETRKVPKRWVGVSAYQ
ncbi:hypothetical protein LTR36_002101 [Oleoguttula mirabilis]|uniref:Uncharacterized protein n=1 Tax=Oleoguttula mirabilis TaxID=1507867 RepID=A0AAV9JLP1_9PEZI|nr:hypothetical protein LTR36_002101 [Oleoguttula mirabilis]